MCVIFGPKMEEYCPEMCFGHIRLLVALYQANLITLVKRHICGTQGVCVPNFAGVAPTLPIVLLFTNSLGRTHARTHGRTDGRTHGHAPSENILSWRRELGILPVTKTSENSRSASL